MNAPHEAASDGPGSSEREVRPHKWALSIWARVFRRLGRRWIVIRHVERLCRPLRIEGAEHLARVRTPAIVIANHSGHFDTPIVLSILPSRLHERIAVAAAADRFYRDRLKGAWFSLRYNTFPINRRGGGSASLKYSEWLLAHGWSLLIFPEGTRSRTGELGPFHPGPAILAVRQGVPVVPIHIDGSARILPVGERWARSAAVRVGVGPPLTFGATEDIAKATSRLEEAVRAQAPAARDLGRSPLPVG